MSGTTLRDQDFDAWLAGQAAALRSGRLDELDLLDLAEELEDMGGSRRDAVESHLARIFEHLLKLEHSPARAPRRGWMESVATQRGALVAKLSNGGRLHRHVAETFEACYRRGRKVAAVGLRWDKVPADALPEACPYTLVQVLDEDWWPKSRHGLD